MAFKKIGFVINPAAGQPKPVLHSINTVLREHPKIEWEARVTTLKHPAVEMAQGLVKDGCDLIVACGGDGTVKEVIDGIAGSNIPLGILHGGTGNALAHWLKIPVDHGEATALLLAEHQLKGLDLGKVTCDSKPKDHGLFVLRASIGLQHQIMETASREMKDRFGNLAYVMASVQSLTSGATSESVYHITIDGQEVEATGVTCMIANSASVGGANSFEFAPNVDPTDGMLDVFVFGAGLQGLLTAVSSVVRWDETLFPQRWKGKKITVRAGEKQEITLDGEVFGDPPFTATVEKGAVKVVVPKEA